ncbi:MAG: TetR/AcrR family transcriptional regulator [Defluviitaleaceae bacterium]|nr:TetR/AcrR family transcriptional regulator [Defluviitaleaceae bacterium]
MSQTPYHHGDLRTAMIKKGIEIINENGAKTLSLRKLAAACGVSHAAPYSHFANREELFSAIEKYITDQFAAVLKESVRDTGETPEGLFRMGCAYVLFFARNPEYFRFIFTHSDITVGDGHEYEPYDFYRRFMVKMFNKIGYPKELRNKTVIAQWAMIHGLACIAVMSGIEDLQEWEEKAPDMLANNYLIFKYYENT